MKTLILIMGLAGLFVQQGGSCSDCPDPSRPWMRGNVEIMCAITEDLEAAKGEHPGRNIVDCHCKHTCDWLGERADETDGRKWDAQCSARCSTKGCLCPHPCSS